MQWYGEVPRYITVSIGYPSWVEWQLRQRDLTPTDDGHFGNSAGGRFGMFVLLSQPATFGRYILGSPALTWEDGLILKQAESFAASGKSVSARLFMASGSLESERMISDMLEIARLLETVEGLEIETRVFPDESHATAFRLSYSHGVRWACPKPEVPFLKAYEMALKDQAQLGSN